jgi:hypothetical protein
VPLTDHTLRNGLRGAGSLCRAVLVDRGSRRRCIRFAIQSYIGVKGHSGLPSDRKYRHLITAPEAIDGRPHESGLPSTIERR